MAKQRGEYYIRTAEKQGCRTAWGKGDHCKVYAPDNSSMISIPYNLKGNGTECAIIKWFKKVGLLLVLIFGAAWFFGLF